MNTLPVERPFNLERDCTDSSKAQWYQALFIPPFFRAHRQLADEPADDGGRLWLFLNTQLSSEVARVRPELCVIGQLTSAIFLSIFEISTCFITGAEPAYHGGITVELTSNLNCFHAAPGARQVRASCARGLRPRALPSRRREILASVSHEPRRPRAAVFQTAASVRPV